MSGQLCVLGMDTHEQENAIDKIERLTKAKQKLSRSQAEDKQSFVCLLCFRPWSGFDVVSSKLQDGSFERAMFEIIYFLS